MVNRMRVTIWKAFGLVLTGAWGRVGNACSRHSPGCPLLAPIGCACTRTLLLPHATDGFDIGPVTERRFALAAFGRKRILGSNLNVHPVRLRYLQVSPLSLNLGRSIRSEGCDYGRDATRGR